MSAPVRRLEEVGAAAAAGPAVSDLLDLALGVLGGRLWLRLPEQTFLRRRAAAAIGAEGEDDGGLARLLMARAAELPSLLAAPDARQPPRPSGPPPRALAV
jgi:hypothetical protein